MLAGTLLGALGMLAFSTDAQPTPDRSVASVSWQRLDFRAKKLLWTATTEVELTWPSTEALADQLLETPEGTGLPPRPPVALLATRSAFAGRSDQVELWFESDTGRALQRRKVRFGSKAYLKTYRFTADGVFSHRVSPTEDERGLEQDSWSQIEDSTISQAPDRCSRVTEPTALLYTLTAAELEVGDRLELCTFSNKRTQRVVVRVEECVPLEVDHRLVERDGTAARRRGTIETLRVRIAPTDPENEGFEFLGMEGAIDLFVDLEHRLPVRLEGRLGALGRLRVELDAAHFAEPTPSATRP